MCLAIGDPREPMCVGQKALVAVGHECFAAGEDEASGQQWGTRVVALVPGKNMVCTNPYIPYIRKL